MTDQEFVKMPLNDLVDIRDVKIDRSLPMEERVPYHFRVGNTKVKVSYAGKDKTLTDLFCDALPFMT